MSDSSMTEYRVCVLLHWTIFIKTLTDYAHLHVDILVTIYSGLQQHLCPVWKTTTIHVSVLVVSSRQKVHQLDSLTLAYQPSG